jgi:hypothetical protein
MLITPHVATGAAVALALPYNPGAVLFLAVLSHFLLDLVPHWDPDMRNLRRAAPYLAIDVAVAGIVCAVIAVQASVPALTLAAGVLGGVLPDLVEFGWMRVKKARPPYLRALHDRLHWYQPKPGLGLLTQAVYLGGLAVLLSR